MTNIERIRYAGDEPLAIMHNAVPVDVVALRPEDLEQRGLYEILRSVGRRAADREPGGGGEGGHRGGSPPARRPARRADATMTRTAWDESGRGVEYGLHVYRASRYSFELTLTC